MQFTSVPWPIGSSGGQEGRFGRDPLPVFPAGGHCEQFWHGQRCPILDVVHPAFPLPTTALPTLQGALRMVLERLSWRVTWPNHAGFRLLTVVRRGSCGPTRKLILHRTLSLSWAPTAGDAEKFPYTFGFESLDSLRCGEYDHTFHTFLGRGKLPNPRENKLTHNRSSHAHDKHTKRRERRALCVVFREVTWPTLQPIPTPQYSTR